MAMNQSDITKQMLSMQRQIMQNALMGPAGGLGSAFDPWGPSDPEAIKKAEERKKQSIANLAEKIGQLRNSEPIQIRHRIPDVLGTITAWRGWRVQNGKLTALGKEGIWEPKKAEKAACAMSAHPAPTKDCSCGYWSFRDMNLLQQALEPYAGTVIVLGGVEIWGKVIECTNGFRSEYAYPKELWLLKEDLDHLSWEYGVPVRRIENEAA